MRVLLSTYGSSGDVEPMVGLAVQLRALGAEAWVCAPPNFAELLACVGVPRVPADRPAGAPAGDRGDAALSEGCDALVATGVMPAGVRL